MMDNYPDDIRSYDHDPRSPFYQERPCEDCGEAPQDCTCDEDEEE